MVKNNFSEVFDICGFTDSPLLQKTESIIKTAIKNKQKNKRLKMKIKLI